MNYELRKNIRFFGNCPIDFDWRRDPQGRLRFKKHDFNSH